MPTEMVLKTMVVQGAAQVGNVDVEACEATSRMSRAVGTIALNAVSINQ